MKKFRILAAVLAVFMCFTLVSPVSFAADYDFRSYQAVEYSQYNTLQLGERVKITGTPNYGAYTSNDSTTLLAIDTADGTWFAAIGPASVEAFKVGIPAGELTLYGVFGGTMNDNGMPILDIQQGTVYHSDERWLNEYTYAPNIIIANTTSVITLGQAALDKQAEEAAAKAAQEAAEKATEEQQWKKTGVMVWIPIHGGECYHTKKWCSRMIDPERVDLGYAKYLGYRECKLC